MSYIKYLWFNKYVNDREINDMFHILDIIKWHGPYDVFALRQGFQMAYNHYSF